MAGPRRGVPSSSPSAKRSKQVRFPGRASLRALFRCRMATGLFQIFASLALKHRYACKEFAISGCYFFAVSPACGYPAIGWQEQNVRSREITAFVFGCAHFVFCGSVSCRDAWPISTACLVAAAQRACPCLVGIGLFAWRWLARALERAGTSCSTGDPRGIDVRRLRHDLEWGAPLSSSPSTVVR